MADKKNRREIKEWLIILAVGLTLYVTGLHTHVIGFAQRAILSTGIITPDLDGESELVASYDFLLQNVNDEIVPFDTFKGKTIFINFWATWCPPCIAEMPDINDLYTDIEGELVFLIVSVDEDQEKAKKYVMDKGYKMPLYFPASSIPTIIKSNSIPTTLVISPEGKIVSKREGMAKYNTEEFKSFLKSL